MVPRVVATAIALSTLSFAAGVAGDLSMADPPNYGERVVVRIPPEIPADALRAGPLPPLVHTAVAEALPRRAVAARLQVTALAVPSVLSKPEPGAQALLPLPKTRGHELFKPLRRKTAG